MNICCSICMDSYIEADNVGITECGHLFHNACLTGWLSGKKNESTCPQCRKDIQIKNLQKVFFNQADDIDILKCKCKDYKMQIKLLKDDLERVNQMYKQLEIILFEEKDIEKGLGQSISEAQSKDNDEKVKISHQKNERFLEGTNTRKQNSNKIAALRKNFEAMGRLPIAVKPPEPQPTAPSLNVVNERETNSETQLTGEECALRIKLNMAEQRAKQAEKHLQEKNMNDEIRIKARVDEELAKVKVLHEVSKLQYHESSVSINNEVEAFIKLRLETAEKRIMAADAHAKAAEHRARAIEQRVQAQLRAANQRALSAEQRAITAEQVILAQQRKTAVFHIRR